MHISSIIWIVSGVSNSVFCLFWECTVHKKLPGMYLRRLWTSFSMRSSHFASLRSTRCGQSGSRESTIYSIKCWPKILLAAILDQGKGSNVIHFSFIITILHVLQGPIFHHLSWSGISRGVFWYFGKVSMDSLHILKLLTTTIDNRWMYCWAPIPRKAFYSHRWWNRICPFRVKSCNQKGNIICCILSPCFQITILLLFEKMS